MRRRSPPGPRCSRSGSCPSSTSAEPHALTTGEGSGYTPPTDPFPLAVDLDREAQTLSISWEDGHTSGYSARALRWACPCAECRGEGFGSDGKLDRVTDLDPAETELDTLVLVGRYALQMAFRSGHATGIYTFRYLRSLCNCPECARQAD